MKYGQETSDNAGVSQGSAMSAPLYIIYIGEMMEDYDALNNEAHIPIKHANGETSQEIDRHVSEEIRQKFALKQWM